MASPLTFARPARLSTGADYSRVFRRPRVSRDDCFRVLYRPNGGPISRLGLAVSRKTCKTAVGRHRLKRLIRESFRVRQPRLAGHGAVDIVVIPTPAAVARDNENLRSCLAQHWKRIEAAVRRRSEPSTE